jgi:hypothetical protein
MTAALTILNIMQIIVTRTSGLVHSILRLQRKKQERKRRGIYILDITFGALIFISTKQKTDVYRK